MNARPLVLDETARARIKAVVEYAKAHPVDLRQLVRTLGNETLAVGSDAQHVCEIDFGYRCVFSIEEQPPPVGLCRHLSISVNEKGKGPALAAVDALAREFGFKGSETAVGRVWREDLEDGYAALNLVQQIEKKGATE